MKRFKLLLFASVLLFMGFSMKSYAQCNLSTSTMYATAAAPTDCSPISVTTSAYCAEPVSVTGLVAGNTYLFTVSNSTATQYPNYTFNLYSGTTSGTAPVSFISATTAPTTAAPLTITYTPATSGTMSMQLFDLGCTASGSGHGLNSFSVQCLSCAAPAASTNQPSSGTVQQGVLNAQVLRLGIPVCASPGVVSSITFGTTGSTSPATDLINAKVYYTSTTTFSATTQFGSTVVNPNGTFTVTGSQTIPASSTGYFWLTYDIACNATVANIVDAEVTSYTSSAVAYTPAITNPSGTRAVAALYAPTRTDGNSTTAITGGAINNTMVYANINGSASCPASVTTITGAASGTFATGEVVAARCYYTTSSTFTLASAIQFGSTISTPANTDALVFTGSQALANGTGNYFWIVYDISCSAVAAKTVNATITSLTVGSTPYAISTGTISANAINALYAPTRTDGNSTTAITGGAINAQMVYANISGSSNCPASITNVTGAASGTFATGEVVAARCYYTTSSTFTLASAIQFGSTISTPANTDALVFNGSQALANGTGNYFWIVYDISCTAVAANTVNATITSLTVGSTPYAISTGTINANAITALYAPTRTDGNSTTAITGGAINNTMVYANINGSSSCPASVTTVTGSASGTFATGEVVAARCYYTTSSTFTLASATQFGSTISTPANTDALVFTGSQALANGTGNYFWIVYDISCSAVAAKTVNATITSLTVGSTPYAISTGTISANAITALYAPTRTDGNSTTAINVGSVNAKMVYGLISGNTACGAGITKVDFTVSGTNTPVDINQIKCYYTTSSTFSTTTPFGTAIANPAAGTVSFTGSQALTTGSNYFWMVYDINCAATAGNSVNGDVNTIYVNGSPISVTGTATSANSIAAASSTYTTVADGEWSSPSTWTCGAIPPTNAAAVTIATNVTVSNTGNIGGSVTINSGASLTINSGGDLSLGITGGDSKTLTNNGTLSITGGTITQNGNVVLSSGSAFNQSGGNFVVDGNGASSVASGTVLFLINSNLGTVNGGTLTIVDPPATGSASSIRFSTSSAHASWAGHTVKFGDGVSTAASTNTYGFEIDTYYSTGRLLLGNVIVDAGNAANRFAGTSQYSSDGSYIGGNLTINPGSEVRTNSALLIVGGNVINNGTFTGSATLSLLTVNAGTVVASTVPQSISGAGIFRNAVTGATANLVALETWNTSAGGVTLNVPLSLSSTFYLDGGILHTDAVNLLTVGYNAANLGTITRTAGMVVGPIKKWYAAATGTATFPVGDGTNYKPATINFTTAPTSAGTLTARWSATAPAFPNATPLTEGALVVNKVSKQGSWFVDAGDGIAGGVYTATMTGNGSTDVIAFAKTVLVKRPSSGGDWTLEGTHVTSTGSNTAPVLSRTGITTFSEFAIGGEANIALPISIEYFTGTKQAAGNVLNWKVNSSSTSTLSLERSTDKVNYKSINAQTATTTQMQSPFTYTDAAPAAGINYYRLKVTNADGESKYTNVVALLNKEKGFELISIVPNPVQHITILSVSSAKAGKMDLTVSDATGKVVMKQSINVIAGNNPVSLNFSALAAGTYQITAINADGDNKSTRFVKF